MSKHRCAERLGKHILLAILLLTDTYAGGSPPSDKVAIAEKAKWQALIPTIEGVLIRQGSTCPGQRMRVGIVDAAHVAGHSIALVDFCPGGAYTEWIVAMQLEADQPVLARFRKANRKIADLGFAQGASVMHGKDVKLVPEKQAIYDFSWDNDGLDNEGIVKLEKCVVDAYVWDAKSKTFDWDAKLTKQSTRSYCQSLRQQVH
jgi:hypothetical protein